MNEEYIIDFARVILATMAVFIMIKLYKDKI
jgi:hypothetical protein